MASQPQPQPPQQLQPQPPPPQTQSTPIQISLPLAPALSGGGGFTQQPLPTPAPALPLNTPTLQTQITVHATPADSQIQPSNTSATTTPASSSVTSLSSATPNNATTSASAPITNQQVTQLIEDIRHADLQVRLNSFRKIQVIAQALGQQRTRTELIPYLGEFCDDEDEVLLLLATTLGEMVDAVGGSEYAHVLLQPLETLAGTEEAAVRNQSVASMKTICAKLSDAHVVEYMLPLLRRLTTAEWFTSRISSAGLYPTLYPRLNEAQKRELRALFLQLCNSDETPMVKRAAAAHFGEFCSVMDAATVNVEFLPVLQKLAKDDQDSVKLLTVTACIAIAKIFSRENKALNVTKMTSLIKGLVDDKSWRVRFMAADKFCELSSALGPSIAQSDAVLDDFVKLLSDSEAEVRTAAAARVGDIAKLAGEAQTIKKFFNPLPGRVQPVLEAIVKDTDDATSFTRAALASVLLSICTVIKPELAKKHLLPLIKDMLKDKNSDVRLNLISKFESIPNLKDILTLDEINDQILQSINDDELGLAKNLKWRVRLQVIQLIPNLAKQLGSDFFDSKLSAMCMAWLGDSVWSIREAATSNLTKLAEGFGIDWASKNIIPKVKALGKHPSYLYRMTAVFAIKDMATVLGPELTTKELRQVLLDLADDQVPNVRFNVARVLGHLVTQGLFPPPQPQVEQVLIKLKSDPDADVKYYAEQSLAEINKPK